MTERAGQGTEQDKHKARRNWFLGIGIIAAFVSVPVALLSFTGAVYQQVKSEKK